MRRRSNWRNPMGPGGIPRGDNGAELIPQVRYLCVFFQFRPLALPISPFPNTQRFGGFETPGIFWWAE